MFDRIYRVALSYLYALGVITSRWISRKSTDFSRLRLTTIDARHGTRETISTFYVFFFFVRKFIAGLFRETNDSGRRFFFV